MGQTWLVTVNKRVTTYSVSFANDELATTWASHRYSRVMVADTSQSIDREFAKIELNDHVDTYEHTFRAVLSLGRDVDDAMFSAATECPGWSVRDVLAHIAHLESWAAGRPQPAIELTEDIPHVNNQFGVFTESGVRVRAEMSSREVLAELNDLLVDRLTWFRSGKHLLTDEIASPFGGNVTLRAFITQRIVDIWMHEQDIRRAVRRYGNLSSPAAAVVMNTLRQGVERVLTRAGLDDDTVVRLVVTGPGGFDDTYLVTSADTPVPQAEIFEATRERRPECTLTMDVEAFTRRSSGRWPVEKTPYVVHGNEDVGAAVLASLVVTP